MSEIEIKEAAERYADKYWEDFAVHDVIAQTLLHTKNDSKNAFIDGCEYADKEAHNRCLDEVDIALGRVFDGVSPELHEEIIEELQKLRK
jgi:hypothetical protein